MSIEGKTGSPDFILEMNDHSSVVNVARFSPCGKYLATASDRQIIVYSGINELCFVRIIIQNLYFIVISPDDWSTIVDNKMIERNVLRTSLDEIYDLQWSPDSEYIVAGSIDTKVSFTNFINIVYMPLQLIFLPVRLRL